jgi:acyl carrier protein
MLEEEAVRRWIIEYLAEFLDIPVEEVRSDRPYQAYGLDSADSVLVGGALEERFDVEIDATVFLRNDTVDALIADLRNSGLIA